MQRGKGECAASRLGASPVTPGQFIRPQSEASRNLIRETTELFVLVIAGGKTNIIEAEPKPSLPLLQSTPSRARNTRCQLRTFTIAALAMIAAPSGCPSPGRRRSRLRHHGCSRRRDCRRTCRRCGRRCRRRDCCGNSLASRRLASRPTSSKRPSYTYQDEVRVGTAPPASGVQYYEVPPQYGVKNYRHTVFVEQLHGAGGSGDA